MYLYSYPSTHGIISGLAAGGASEQFEVGLNMMIKETERYTLRRWWSEFGDAIRHWDWVNSEMHWVAAMKRVWWCNWRLRLSELRDALGGSDRASLEMQLEIVIEWTQRFTGRPSWCYFGDAHRARGRVNTESKFGDAIGDQDWVNSEMHLEAVIEQVWTCTGRP